MLTRLLSRVRDWLRMVVKNKVQVVGKDDLVKDVRDHDENSNAHGGLTGSGGVSESDLATAAAAAKAEAIAAAASDATTKDQAVAQAAALDAQIKADQAETDALAAARSSSPVKVVRSGRVRIAPGTSRSSRWAV